MTGCQGQDWASYQDWSPSTQGLGFVFIKATEGTGYVNPRYSSQLAAARSGRLVVGHYHFVRPGPSMQAQADYFLRHLTLKAGDVLALDWEDSGVTGSEKDTFLKYLKSTAPGHKVVLYCNKDFWLNRDHTSYAADGLWIADPDAPAGQPRVRHPWLFHQYGSPHGMDVDYCRLDAAGLAAWAAGTAPSPAPTPEKDMQSTDKITVPAGTWTKDPQTWTVGEWIAYGNLKADRAAAQAAAANAALKALTAQVAALTATVGALAKGGGLTAEQITAAAKAGADEALAQLGHALDGTQP